MEEPLIKFLKKHHAWDEFKEEIRTQNNLGDMNNIISQAVEYSNDESVGDVILEDSNFFFYSRAVTDIDWHILSEKWKKNFNILRVEL